jgi:hypothetical protein
MLKALDKSLLGLFKHYTILYTRRSHFLPGPLLTAFSLSKARRMCWYAFFLITRTSL